MGFLSDFSKAVLDISKVVAAGGVVAAATYGIGSRFTEDQNLLIAISSLALIVVISGTATYSAIKNKKVLFSIILVLFDLGLILGTIYWVIGWVILEDTSKAIPSNYGIYISSFESIGTQSHVDPNRVQKSIYDRLNLEVENDSKLNDVFIRREMKDGVVADKLDARQRINKYVDGEGIIWGSIIQKSNSKRLLETNIDFGDPHLTSDKLRAYGFNSNSLVDLTKKVDLDIVLKQELAGKLNCTVFLGIGILKYERKDYLGSIPVLERALENCRSENAEDNSVYGNFYLTACYIKIGDLKTAKFYWNQVKRDGNAKYKLGLAFNLYDDLLIPHRGLYQKAPLKSTLKKDSNLYNAVVKLKSNDRLGSFQENHLDTSSVEISNSKGFDWEYFNSLEVFQSSPNDKGGFGVRVIGTSKIIIPPTYCLIERIYSGNFFFIQKEKVDTNRTRTEKAVFNTLGKNVTGWFDEINISPSEDEIGVLGKIASRIGKEAKKIDSKFALQRKFHLNKEADPKNYAFCTKKGEITLFNFDDYTSVSIPYDSFARIDKSSCFFVKKDEKYGWVTLGRYGEVYIYPCLYDSKPRFNVGLATISLNGKWGIIGQNGKMMSPFEYADGLPLLDGVAAMKNENGKWGFVDRLGRSAIPFRFQQACSFYNGLAAVKLRNRWFFIDHSGHSIGRFTYDEIRQDFSKSNMAIGVVGQKTYNVNKAGKRTLVTSR